MSNDTTNNQSQSSTSRAADRPTGALQVTRTELVWPGKYNDDGTRKEVPRVSLPFQVIETVDESQATRQAKKEAGPTLFDLYEGDEGDTFASGWKNKLIWGDNLLVMGSLLSKFAGKVNLIYIDPPFATGADFSFSAQIGAGDMEVAKEQSLIEEKAYRDTWGRGLDSYLSMMNDRLTLIHELLAPTGSLYLHCDWRVNSYLRCIIDQIFGPDNFVNEITWKRRGGILAQSRQYGASTDTILFVAKTPAYVFHPPLVKEGAEDYVEERFKYTDDKSRRYRLSPIVSPSYSANLIYEYKGYQPPKNGWSCSRETMERWEKEGKLVFPKEKTQRIQRKQYLDEWEGRPVQTLWTDIPPINPQAKERLGYATQKPETLLERILRASTNEGDLVADVFCGSGTTCSVAEKLKRRWIGCDLGRYSIHTTRKRLLDIGGCKPFEVLNLGKYERQYWQGVTFKSKEKEFAEQSLYEYLAFVLKLYGAQPVAGMAHLHGKKGRGMVHIGAVDAPVTIDEINLAIEECAKLKQTELHVLGWEWEMGLYDLMVAEAKKKGVKLLLLQIPREVMEQQAVDKGDIQFFELAYLEIDVQTPKKFTATVTLKDFVIPNTELIPDDVRAKVKKWSDYVDYWAVDWNFQNDTFLQGWVTYRTRDDRTLALTSDPHTYEQKGKYRVLVKVIDIFGNDTSQAFEVEIR